MLYSTILQSNLQRNWWTEICWFFFFFISIIKNFHVVFKVLFFVRSLFLKLNIYWASFFVDRFKMYLQMPTAFEDTWFLGGCSKWAQISWLCFFQHFSCPIFQKKFEVLKNWKKYFLIVPTSKGPPFEKENFKIIFFPFFSNKSYFFTWIWILHVISFLLRYITLVLVKIFKFSLF